jgi:hypothetical protein
MEAGDAPGLLSIWPESLGNEMKGTRSDLMTNGLCGTAGPSNALTRSRPEITAAPFWCFFHTGPIRGKPDGLPLDLQRDFAVQLET